MKKALHYSLAYNGSLNFTVANYSRDVGGDFKDDHGPSIGAFWSDLDPRGHVDARIYMNNSTFNGDDAYIFTWFNIPDIYNNDLINTFQAIITETGQIQLNFLSLDGVDHRGHLEAGVIGISDGSGSDFDYQTMDTWTFPRSGFSIGYALDNGTYVRSEWDWEPSAAPVPEPSTLILLGIGLLGFAGVNRRKK